MGGEYRHMLTERARGRLLVGGNTVFWLCATSGAEPGSAFLAPAETAAYAALRAPKRRRDWLLGRRVAKRLIQDALAERGHHLPLDEIVILSHPDGWPQVTLPALGPDAPSLTLSISHARDRAFCAVTFGADVPLGADLEAVEPRSSGFVADYFTSDERDFVAVAPEEERPVLVNAIWSAKEAALKAIRRGLAEDTRLVTCLPTLVKSEDGWHPIGHRWEATGRNLPVLAGVWREADGYVMTLAATASPTKFSTSQGEPV